MASDEALEVIATCLCSLQNGWALLSPWGKAMWVKGAGEFAKELAARGWSCVPNPEKPAQDG
jgi:hypothetical protein